MASAAGIRLGKVFVEIGADPSKLFGALNKLNKRIGSIGSSMTNFGGRMTALGVGMAAPIALAVRAGTSFESVLKNISASTGATAGDIGRINAAAMQMSEAMGTGPTAIAQGFLELLKAGMPLEAVLGGAGKAALEFAKVGELAVADAAVVMSDAMNVFGVDAANAANTMSAAADASSTSIQEIAMAFTQVSAVAAQSNQGIDDVAAALALMANAGVKGSDAGTSLKNMFAKLKSPVDSAATALESIGLSTESFRDASGAMLPLAQQIEVLRNATAGLDQAAKDDVFQRVFGTDAIRAALILTEAGAAGIDGMKKSMGDALPVSEKFRQLQSGLAGVGATLMASLERLAIAITAALGPSLIEVGGFLTNVINSVVDFVRNNEELVVGITKGIAAFTAIGLAITGVGLALSGVSAVVGIAMSPLVAIPLALGAAVAGLIALGDGMSGLASAATQTFGGIYDAITAGDLGMAFEILMAGWNLAWAKGSEALLNGIDYLSHGMYETLAQAFTTVSAVVMGTIDNLVNGVMLAFDNMIAAVRKSWNYVQSFLRRGFDLAAENAKVDNEMAARAQARAVSRPGIAERMERGQAEYEQARAGREETMVAIQGQRAAGSAAAQADLDALTQQASAKSADVSAASTLQNDLGGAKTMDELGSLGNALADLLERGNLTADREKQLIDAYNSASEKIGAATAAIESDAAKKADPKAVQDAALAAAAQQSEVVGSFSSVGLSGMGFGSNLQQQQLEEQKKTNKILEDKLGDDGLIGD